ncbi:hypothetical protein P9112_004138 [Eukaryota sp. TZLM1-RC]
MVLRREYLSLAGLRVDGRRSLEVRNITFSLGSISNADGSVTYSQGNTKLLVSVFGPKEASRRRDVLHDTVSVKVEFGQSLFASGEKRERRRSDRFSTELSMQIKSIVQNQVIASRYPKSEIVVSIQLLQSDGSVLAAAINATTLALIDAGIAINDFIVACSGGFIGKDILLDLTSQEESGPCLSVVLSFAPSESKCALAQMNNRLPIDMFEDLYDALSNACDVIHSQLSASVKSFVLNMVRS